MFRKRALDGRERLDTACASFSGPPSQAASAFGSVVPGCGASGGASIPMHLKMPRLELGIVASTSGAASARSLCAIFAAGRTRADLGSEDSVSDDDDDDSVVAAVARCGGGGASRSGAEGSAAGGSASRARENTCSAGARARCASGADLSKLFGDDDPAAARLS